MNVNSEVNIIPKSLVVKPIVEIKATVNEYRSSVSLKINEARQKRIAMQQKELLPSCMLNPKDLVGKTIKQRCMQMENLNGIQQKLLN